MENGVAILTFDWNAAGIGSLPLLQAAVAGLEVAFGLLLVIISLILLTACTKFARLGAGAKGFAAGTALPFGSKRIIVQWVVEGVLLALLGGAVGLYLGEVGTHAAVALLPAEISGAQFMGISAESTFPMLVVLLSARIPLARRPILRIDRLRSSERPGEINSHPSGPPPALRMVYRSRARPMPLSKTSALLVL